MYFNKQFCERTTTYYVIRIKINDIFIYPNHPELFPRIIFKKKNLISLVNNQISNTSFSIKIEFKKKKVKFFLSFIKNPTHINLFSKLFKFSFNWLKILKKTRIKFLLQNFSKSNQLIFLLFFFFFFIVARFSFQFTSPSLQPINFHREISRKDSVGNDGRIANTHRAEKRWKNGNENWRGLNLTEKRGNFLCEMHRPREKYSRSNCHAIHYHSLLETSLRWELR